MPSSMDPTPHRNSFGDRVWRKSVHTPPYQREHLPGKQRSSTATLQSHRLESLGGARRFCYRGRVYETSSAGYSLALPSDAFPHSSSLALILWRPSPGYVAQNCCPQLDTTLCVRTLAEGHRDAYRRAEFLQWVLVFCQFSQKT